MYFASSEEKQRQDAEPDKHPEDDPISPPFCSDLPDQGIDARDLARSQNDPSVDIGKSLPLQIEALVDRVGLAENAINHIVAVVDTAPLLEHVVSLSGGRISRAVCVDVRADIGEQVDPVAGLRYSGGQALELVTVVMEDFSVARQVVLLQGGGCEGRFGVEKTRELGDEGFTLCRC